MTKEQLQIARDIEDTISNFTLTPYSKVKKNLDAISLKTRKALGGDLRKNKRPTNG
jgi:hypothetical protein